jgi:hypothetical protein
MQSRSLFAGLSGDRAVEISLPAQLPGSRPAGWARCFWRGLWMGKNSPWQGVVRLARRPRDEHCGQSAGKGLTADCEAGFGSRQLRREPGCGAGWVASAGPVPPPPARRKRQRGAAGMCPHQGEVFPACWSVAASRGGYPATRMGQNRDVYSNAIGGPN